jgi:dephospho-CoA kinase
VYRIALTGGIASGKSTVADFFARRGVPVIDSDRLAREVVAANTPGLAAVRARFGADVIDQDGTLDRRALRARVFADPSARRDLESILHPLIRQAMAEESARRPGPYQLFAIPLLVESGRAAEFDRVLVVDCPEALQIRRVMARDGSDEAGARAVLAAQASRHERLAVADDVIENAADLASLETEVAALHERYLAAAARQASRVAGAPPATAE